MNESLHAYLADFAGVDDIITNLRTEYAWDRTKALPNVCTNK